MKQQLYADLPPELHEADNLLHRYGRWARGGGGGARCGSAEGMYRAPQDDEDRQPREPTLAPLDAERVARCLSKLPMMTLLVLQWLYVDTHSLQAKMRKYGIQPMHMRERHLEGVQAFWKHWRAISPRQSVAPASQSLVVLTFSIEHQSA